MCLLPQRPSTPITLGWTHWAPSHRDMSFRQCALLKEVNRSWGEPLVVNTTKLPRADGCVLCFNFPFSFLPFFLPSFLPFLPSFLPSFLLLLISFASHSRARAIWVQIPVLLLISCVAVRKLLNLSVPQHFLPVK